MARVLRKVDPAGAVWPTAHASPAENALTPVNSVSAPAGPATTCRLHADPFQRNATAVFAPPAAAVDWPTANALPAEVASTPVSSAQLLAPPLSRSGLGKRFHRVPLNRWTTPLPLPPTAQPSVGETASTPVNPPMAPADAAGTWVTVAAHAGPPLAMTRPAASTEPIGIRNVRLIVLPLSLAGHGQAERGRRADGIAADRDSRDGDGGGA